MAEGGSESDWNVSGYFGGHGEIIARKDLRIAVVVMPENCVRYPRCARLIDLPKVNFSELSEGASLNSNLHAVDVIASVLYNWNQDALHALLDLDINHFHFGRVSQVNFETYVTRWGRTVTAGSREVGASKPDFEIKYGIRNNRAWEIKGARDQYGTDQKTYGADHDACLEYDYILASNMLWERMWKKEDGVTFRFEVNGECMLSENEGQEDQDDRERPVSRCHLAD